MRGIRLLLDRGLPLALKTVAVSTNRHEIPAMQRFAEDELGVPFKFDSMINPRVDCSQSPLDVRLAPEECVALDLADPKRSDEWMQFAERCPPARSRRSRRTDTRLPMRRRRQLVRHRSRTAS